MSKITPPPAMTDEKIDEICDAALYADGPYGSLVSRSTEVARDKQWLDLLAQKQDRERNFEEFGEGWESLAWELCAQEHGEEACSELIWEGGPIPELWGDRWLKYEDEAKRLIALVHKHAAPVAQQADRQQIYDAATYASAMAVFMTRMDAEQPDADDKGVSGWLQDAEDRIRSRASQPLEKLISQADRQRVPTIEELTEKIASMLHGTYHCTRVWEAWNVGTMSEEDFGPVDESDTPAEIAAEIHTMLAAAPEAPAQADTDVINRGCRYTTDLMRAPAQGGHCGGRENCGRFPFCGCGGPEPLPERDPTKPAEHQGLFRKFDVRRTDGSDKPGGKHHGCEYFVLDVQHDQHAHQALSAYADAVESTHPHLARDMRERYELASSEAPAQASAVDERAAFEAWVARVKPTYWRAEAWQTEAWAMWQSISAALAQKGDAA